MLAWPKNTRIHFVGIGGIGMSGIAEVLLDLGYAISGSDLSASTVTEKLIRKGAKIFTGHEGHFVEGSQLLIYSSAIKPENPELMRALQLKIPFMRRGELLAEIMKSKTGIAIAGSHGKTTTTSLVATILREAQLDPSFIIGGLVSNLDGNAHLGQGIHLVAEADESDGSFLSLHPQFIALTNIDDDHIDYYGSKQKIESAFTQFANNLPDDGTLLINGDDAGSRELRVKKSVNILSYRIDNSQADYVATNIKYSASGTSFNVIFQGMEMDQIHSQMLGKHNVSNCLAAISLCHQVGVEWAAIRAGLASFQGVGRRLEKVFEKDDFVVIDDYGHHPTEIKATIAAIKQVDQRPLCVVFEPHRFSRTQNFWNEFKQSFELVDELYVAPVYAASELPIPGINSNILVQEMRSDGRSVQHLDSLDHMEKLLRLKLDQPGVFLTLGAGAISIKIRELVKAL